MNVLFDKRWKHISINKIKFWRKLAISSKKNLTLNLYIKKYLKDERKSGQKESFQCIYTPVILIDSVYRKDKNYSHQLF